MSVYIEIIAVILGISSVWYARKENILVFPFGIANVLIYVYICIISQLYANAGINVIYLITNIFGWYNWSKHRANEAKLPITYNTLKQSVISWIAVLFVYIGALLVLRYFNRTDLVYIGSYVPFIDSSNTAFFLVATVLMALKKVDNWIFWIIGNILSIPIYLSQGLYFTALQYSVFLFLAILGYREWKRKVL